LKYQHFEVRSEEGDVDIRNREGIYRPIVSFTFGPSCRARHTPVIRRQADCAAPRTVMEAVQNVQRLSPHQFIIDISDKGSMRKQCSVGMKVRFNIVWAPNFIGVN